MAEDNNIDKGAGTDTQKAAPAGDGKSVVSDKSGSDQVDGKAEGGVEKGAVSHREIFAKELVEKMSSDQEFFKDGMFLGKYKNIEELVKGHKNLAELATKKNQKAPAEYDVSQFKVEGLEGFEFDPEHPLSKAALPVFKELGLSQEAANKLIAASLAAQYVNPKEELKKLHTNEKEAVAIYTEVASFVKANIPEELQDAASRFTETADGVKLIKHFMESRLDREIPDGTGQINQGKTWQQLEEEAFAYKDKHSKTIGSNPAQQAEYQRLMSAATSLKLKAKKGG